MSGADVAGEALKGADKIRAIQTDRAEPTSEVTRLADGLVQQSYEFGRGRGGTRLAARRQTSPQRRS